MTSPTFTYVEVSSKSKATSLSILILKHVYFCIKRTFSCVTQASRKMQSLGLTNTRKSRTRVPHLMIPL